MGNFKTSPEQLAKNREYKRKNKERLKIQTYRSNGILFIKEYAQLEDLNEFKRIIEDREDELKNSWWFHEYYYFVSYFKFYIRLYTYLTGNLLFLSQGDHLGKLSLDRH